MKRFLEDSSESRLGDGINDSAVSLMLAESEEATDTMA
jgi:hypothetical protein